MKRIISIILLFLPAVSAFSQEYVVSRTSFSSRMSDEFSPVYYGNGLVFCANIRDNSPVSYNSEEGRLFKIFFVEGSDSTGWRKPVLFSDQLTSDLNDGPACFTPDSRTIYFSRNTKAARKFRNTVDKSNRLGIFFASLEGAEWNSPVLFSHNDSLYSFSTPCVSPDGRKLYFASDMPGGFGELDLYVCELKDNEWSEPVNLGSSVNTMGNEAFPFADGNNILWFASDGHGGLGMKDLFYTSENNGKWLKPSSPGAPLNSPADDFGLVISASGKGFFSSNRLGSDDIFQFSTAPPVFDNCQPVRENRYCFTFYDEQHGSIDTLQARYIWDFGGGDIREGEEAWYCFPGPGNYAVFLTIIDELTGDTITSKSRHDVSLKDIEQGYIKSPDQAARGSTVVFDGTRIDLVDFSVTGYWWDLGEGYFPAGAVVAKEFRKPGEYEVKMGLTGEKDGARQTYCYTKKILVN